MTHQQFARLNLTGLITPSGVRLTWLAPLIQAGRA